MIPAAEMIFRARQFEVAFPRPALVMGIVNVTPDSFSDGGKFLDAAAAAAHALKMVELGADLLDIGGESTRPGAAPVSDPLSIDTTKPAVARAALQAGASIVNDAGARIAGEAMWRAVAEFQAGYVCLHSQGPPATMQANPVYADVVLEVGEFFEERLEAMTRRGGIAPEQVALDVGIGFGKTLEHNLQLLAHLQSFGRFRRPLLLGVSRKSFIGHLLGAGVDERLPASLVCASLAVESGVQIIRTHDVAETVQAVRMAEAVLARKKN
jgi:dihydropteroate synthase